MKPRMIIGLTSVLAAGLFALTAPAAAGGAQKQEQLVDKARVTFEAFVTNPEMEWLRDRLKDAKAVFIVPQLLKGGFIFGMSGGSGVVLARDEKTGEWSEPAFYTMGSGSFGLQAGASAAEVLLMVMTEKGMDSMLTSSFKLGADVEIAAGPVGGGRTAKTADIVSFSRSKGLFGGLAFEGAVITPRDKWNNAYYGKPVRPLNILVSRTVSNSHSAKLRRVVSKATR